MICRVLARFAGSEIFTEIVKNVTEIANRGKMGHIDSVNRSKNVVGIGGFYYCGILAKIYPLRYQTKIKNASIESSTKFAYLFSLLNNYHSFHLRHVYAYTKNLTQTVPPNIVNLLAEQHPHPDNQYNHMT